MSDSPIQKFYTSSAAAPAFEDEITYEGLDLYLRSSHQTLVNLEILDRDLELLRNKKKITFALDFSEIFTYLFPEKSHTQHKQTTRLLLESEFLKFTLLPGTTVELVRSLTRILADSRSEQRGILEDQLKSPFVDAFFDFVGKQTHSVELVESAFAGKFRGYSDKLESLDRLIDRLTQFKNARNIVPFDEIVRDHPSVAADSDIFRRVYSSLNIYRRGASRDLNNNVDAYNYALIWSLTEKLLPETDTVYMAVTSSPHPYRIFKATKFPLRRAVNLRNLPAESSLVRHPLQALALSQILERAPLDGQQQVKALIRNLGYIIEEFGKDEQYQRFCAGRIPPHAVLAFSKSKRFLETFLKFRDEHSRLFSGIREAVEADLIAEENIRWQKGVDSSEVFSRISSPSEDSPPPVSPRALYRIYDQLTKLTLEIIQQNRKVLKSIPESLIRDVDVDGLVIKRPRLRTRNDWNETFSCFELKVFSEKSLFLAGDIYSDFFSFWWPCGVAFTEFLDATRTFLTTLPSGPDNREKMFNGIYIHFQEPDIAPLEVPFEDDPELRLESIYGLIGEKRLQMIRIAHSQGDVCYDFEPFRNIPQRIGFVSHESNVREIAWFIHRTNLRKTAVNEWQGALERVFSAVSKGAEETPT